MASVQLGAIITDMAGSIGGQTVQRGRCGHQMHTKAANTGLKQNDQNQARQKLTAVSTLWRSIGLVDQASWASLSATVTRYNRFGAPYQPSPFQLFCELNFNLMALPTPSQITTAPSLPVMPVLSSATINLDVGSSTIDFGGTVTAGIGSWDWYIQLTRPHGEGSYVPRSSFLDMGSTTSSASSCPNNYTPYVKRIGFTPPKFRAIFGRVSFMDTTNGWRTPFQIIRGITF